MAAQLQCYSTRELPPLDRAGEWSRVISDTYVKLHLRFAEPERFSGALRRRAAGEAAISRLTTAASEYERRADDIDAESDATYLVTLPLAAPVSFTQAGREVVCAPGGFLLEQADAPYRFSYGGVNDLFVLKLPRKMLAERLRDPDRFCAVALDGRNGAGALFATMLRGVDATEGLDAPAAAAVGRGLVDLLALALDGQAEVADGPSSAVRAAHLRRAQALIRDGLSDPDLGPQMLADRMKISKRYLHNLFAERGESVARVIRDQRLRAARDLLALPSDLRMADVAYRFGFSDQASFARQFRAAFGQSPTDWRATARSGR